MRFGKRGEMTTQQIVIMIVLIASFAVLLYFLTQAMSFDNTDKEVCHNSVVTRGSSIVPTDAVPLNCKRTYVCLTEDGSCESMTKPVKVKVKSQDEVYEALSKELADCWWMYGEGKINYVGKDYFENLYCSFCSQIAFDDSLKEIFPNGKISKEEIFYYMANNNYSEGRTYSQYLYKTNDIKKIWPGEFGDIDLNKQVYAMMGIMSEVSTIGWTIAGFAVGAAVTAGALLSPVTGGASLSLIPVVVGGVVGGGAAYATSHKFVAMTAKGSSGNEYLLPTLIEVNSDEFRNLKCDEIASAS